jgi:hypothetical protein
MIGSPGSPTSAEEGNAWFREEVAKGTTVAEPYSMMRPVSQHVARAIPPTGG